VIVTPTPALAGDAPIKLALLPVGLAGSFFDLAMMPGEVRSFQVDVGNDGSATLAVRTYATDVYTIINGGFGGRLREAPKTGMTTWLDYRDETVVLRPGQAIRRGFTISVPATAAPGEYITSLILENDQPIAGGGTVGLDEIIRQAVAVVVTVPGPRVPALVIRPAAQEVLAGASVISIAVGNTGNIRLKPVVGFSLVDGGGVQISRATVQMDTFYAQTETTVELRLGRLLQPGRYEVRLTLDDAASGSHAEAALPLVVDAVPAGAAGVAGAAGATGVAPGSIDAVSRKGATGVPLATALAIAVLGALFGMSLAGLVALRRRRTRPLAPRPAGP
jgi:hypothetical protein